nr:cytochrome P450 [Agasicles hygrophila]
MIDFSSITTILIGISACLIAYISWIFWESFQFWKRKGVPHLKPIIMPFGNSLSLFTGKVTLGEIFSDAYLEFKKQGKKHGGIYYFRTPVYIPVDTEIIKKIVISDAHYFPNHGFYINPKSDILSGHLFNMEGGPWKDLRSKTPAAFTTAKMKKMYGIMQNMVDPFKYWLDEVSDSKKPVEIKSILTRFTIDIIAACGFGMNANTLKNENPDLLHHGRQFFDHQWSLYKNTMVLTTPRQILQAFNFRIFPKNTEDYMRNMFTKIYNYRKDNNIYGDDMASILMKLTELREEEKDFSGKKVLDPLDLDEYCSHMYLFFAAGFETSSSVQTFALFELAKNPNCQVKLRQEINRVLKKHDNKLTYDALMDIKYLENVVDETLRIYPIFPIVPRSCVEDYQIPGTDFTIEKGTEIIVSNMGIQRDPEYYPNPLQFDPDRWTYENKLGRPFVANLPFGEGPRICVGKRFGLLQTKLGLATIIKDYEVSLSDKTTKGFKFVSTELILRKKGDVWLNLKKIENN